MPVAFAAAFAGVFGATVGSFLNVVAYRLPRRESLVRPGSRCPGCATAIKPYDNLPVVGWLLLRGRCRTCAMSISPRYPLVEGITAALAVAVVLTKHSAAEIVLGLVLVARARPDCSDRSRAPHHPQQDHAPGRVGRGGDRLCAGFARRARAADRRRRRRRVPAVLRAGLSARHGDGRRQAGRHARSVSRAIGGGRAARRACY